MNLKCGIKIQKLLFIILYFYNIESILVFNFHTGGFSPLLIDTARTTLADLFKKQGYSTEATGKWHLGLDDDDSTDFFAELKPGPLELGFDYFFGMAASLNMSPHCFIEDYYKVRTPDVPVPDYVFSNHGSLTMTEGWRHEDVGADDNGKSDRLVEKQIENYPDQPFFLYLPTSVLPSRFYKRPE